MRVGRYVRPEPSAVVPHQAERRAGSIDVARVRIATYGAMRLRGHGVVDQKNGAFTLAFKVSGIDGIIYLNTLLWKVEWEETDG